MKFIELFAGIGGFRYGLEQVEGFECVFANEIDKYACAIYRKNYGEKHEIHSQVFGPEITQEINKTQGMYGFDPSRMGGSKAPTIGGWHESSKMYEGDITKIRVEEIPGHDLLVGGFPCQAFSVAGQRRGFDDTRGTLFFEIARILDHHRPKCLLLENVKGLLTHNSGQTFQTILKVLTDLGYDVEWQVLNTRFFGIPQNRERVFIIGHLRGSSGRKVFPIGEDDARNLEESLYGEETNDQRGVEDSKDRRGCAVLTPQRLQKRQNGRRIKEEGEPSFTLTGQDQHGVMRDQMVRRLTPIECERLQGFPDGWTEGISDTQRYKCLGNAVTTKVISMMGLKLWNGGIGS